MRKDELQEIKLRTLKLESQDKMKKDLDTIELKLSRLFSQTHETINGVRRKLTKRRKLLKGNMIIEAHIHESDIEQDALNQIKNISR